jgi:hypothetical protein
MAQFSATGVTYVKLEWLPKANFAATFSRVTMLH